MGGGIRWSTYRRSYTGNTGDSCGNSTGDPNGSSNADAGTDDSRAVKDAAFSLLGSKLDDVGHLLALALGHGVGSGGGETGEGGDGDRGETHDD